MQTYPDFVLVKHKNIQFSANGNDVNPAASNNSSNLRSPGYPPIGPKPIVKSPHGPSPPRGIHKLQQYEDKTVGQNDVLDSNLDQHGVRKENIGSVYPGRDDLDGIDGGVCSTELESRILRELIYAFQGIEGVMIRRKVKQRPLVAMKGAPPSDINASEEGKGFNNIQKRRYSISLHMAMIDHEI